MNELKIFKDCPASDWKQEDQLQALGQMAYMLSLAVEAITKKNDVKTAYEIMNKSWDLYCAAKSEKFILLYHAVSVYIAMEDSKFNSEFHLHYLFNKYACLLIEGCKVVSKKANGKDIPDSWVEVNGELMPVEIKKFSFGEKAKKQLQRYISAYNAIGGVAVARTLDVDLPENITFIPVDRLLEMEKQARMGTEVQ